MNKRNPPAQPLEGGFTREADFQRVTLESILGERCDRCNQKNRPSVVSVSEGLEVRLHRDGSAIGLLAHQSFSLRGPRSKIAPRAPRSRLLRSLGFQSQRASK